MDLYARTKESEFLSIAQRIADNILETKFHRSFFVLSKEHTEYEWINIDNAKEKLNEFFHPEIDNYKNHFLKE